MVNCVVWLWCPCQSRVEAHEDDTVSYTTALHCRGALFAAVTTAPWKQPNRGQQDRK